MTQQDTLSIDPRPKNYLGSILLFIGIFSTATIAGILILLSMPLSFNIAYQVSRLWCGVVMWMAKTFCGIHYQVEGWEHVKDIPAAIVLCNHQSAWETLATRYLFDSTKQSPLLKRSLTWFPIWGWALASLKSIAIDRKKTRESLKILLKKGSELLNQGWWIIVFPEGTRTAPGEVKKFNVGGAMLAQQTGCPVIPVAHNAGDVWPRYSFMKYPGTIKVKIGPVIKTEGRKAADINAEAETWISQAVKNMRET